MRSFEAPDLSPDEFVEKIREKLADRDLAGYVSLELEGDYLLLRVRWMGTTSLDYRLTPSGRGFRAELIRERVAPLHGVFRDRFEGYFAAALAATGARVT
jgi:hypothetical protein